MNVFFADINKLSLVMTYQAKIIKRKVTMLTNPNHIYYYLSLDLDFPSFGTVIKLLYRMTSIALFNFNIICVTRLKNVTIWLS